MQVLADQWITSPVFWREIGLKSRIAFECFLQRHPELLGLRQRIGPAWVWPTSHLERVRRIRDEERGSETK